MYSLQPLYYYHAVGRSCTGNGFNKNVFSRFVYTMLVQAYSAYHSINHTRCMHEEQPGKATFSENL